MTALQEIAENWKLEAKQEDNTRYFFHVNEAEKVLRGEKFYVIGRKGSGKSAISQYILNQCRTNLLSGYNTFAEQLSFKNFPFNELYSLQNGKYTKPNQYITIWKYIIYSCICKLMSRNQNIDSELRTTFLEKLYPETSIKSLSRLIDNWVTKGFGAQIMGTGGDIKIDRISKFESLSWIEKTNILEDVIDKYIDDSNYYIIFDELDEDYRDFETDEERSQYVHLITSLFKAVQDIKSVFRDKKQIVSPIVFLRDDIYLLINDTDKNKWSDFKISIEWDEEKLKSMLAHRISRAIDPKGDILSFKDAWNSVFTEQKVEVGRRKNHITSFSFITRSTQLRPRDYIRYLQVCAERAIENDKTKITPNIIKRVDKGFSNYLKEEIIDEIHAQLPDIQVIFSIISQIRKPIFTIDEFKITYKKYFDKGTVHNPNVDYVLQVLFDFSVIGNLHNNDKIRFFRYINTDQRFNFNERIVVHRGLFKALQIL